MSIIIHVHKGMTNFVSVCHKRCQIKPQEQVGSFDIGISKIKQSKKMQSAYKIIMTTIFLGSIQSNLCCWQDHKYI